MIDYLLFKRRFASIAICLLALIAISLNSAQPAFAQGRIVNTDKFGLIYYSALQASLTVDSSVTNSKTSKSSPLGGAMLFYEIIVNNYFGYEARVGQLDQSISMSIEGFNTDIENTALIIGGSMRAYLQSHRRNGANYYGAVNANLLYSSIKFTNAVDTLNGKTFDPTILLYGAEIGVDYIIRFAGIRAAVGYQSGADTLAQKSANDFYKVSYDTGSIYLAAGVFSFF